MVSVIITTYKRVPAIVLRALNSVLAQTFRDIEIIIVDDSPSEYAYRQDVQSAIEKRKIEQSDVNIIYIAHQYNMGACVARNTGLKAAKGDYIAYLDDDDEWMPEKIEKQFNLISQSDVALVYCGNITINDATNKSIIPKIEYVRGKAFKRLLYSNFIGSTSYPIIRKKYLQEIGGFDPQMQSAQDYDVWLRLAEKYEIDYIPEPLVIYHEHEGERITTNPSKKINGLIRINDKFAHYLNADRKLWWKRHIALTQYYAMNNEKKRAILLWCKCVWMNPIEIRENSIKLIQIVKTCIFDR